MITVEKIGGTSMTKFHDVLNNIILEGPQNKVRYGRVLVVSAYGGVTNLLLEDKKTGKPGIYQRFVDNENYDSALDELCRELHAINETFSNIKLDINKADAFIKERIGQTATYLYHMAEVIASGYVEKTNILRAARELLASIGEVHSAFNSVNILTNNGINSILVDLSGFHDTHVYSLEERIHHSLKDIDVSNNIVIVTGYTKSKSGIMREFDRGYSEVTFSRVAVELNADEAVIHKEFHLSSADPRIVGIENAIPVGQTNFDVADQLADIGMEAIHPKASKPLEVRGIPLRIKNTFEPDHPGTLISNNYSGKPARVEIITGSDKVRVIDIHDSGMVGEVGIDLEIMQTLKDLGISYIAKATNANSISIVVWDNEKAVRLSTALKEKFQEVNSLEAAMVCVIGSNIAQPGVLSKATQVLYENGINIECVSQALRQTNVQFVISRNSFEKAIRCLNRCLCIE
ncbi:MAG: aspartate kinase [Spirochaetales bacterium]|nr:aspartate kinase [Spirochaetales bacterium]